LAAIDDYRRFLIAHAQATFGIEQYLSGFDDLPPWRRRGPELISDLRALGSPAPAALEFVCEGNVAAGMGVLYVLEGSRLGASVLLRRIPEHFPTDFLSARHRSGEWNELLSAIGARVSDGGEAFLQDVIHGAKACFDHYLTAAGHHH